MLYHPNNYWKCSGKKSPLPSKNKLFLQNYSGEKALLQKQCFYWRGIPHKNYFAEISTSHVLFFQSRNDDLWKSPRPACVHICKSALVSFPGGPVGENPPPYTGDAGLIPGPEWSHVSHAGSWCTLSACSSPRESARSEEDLAQSKIRTTKPPWCSKAVSIVQFSQSFRQALSDNGRPQKRDL